MSGQVLACAYEWEKARLVLKEMADQLGLDLVAKGLVTDQLVLHVGYDIDNLKNEEPGVGYQGETKIDRYGRKLPKPAHGTENLGESTASSRLLREHAMVLYDRIVDKKLLIRRLSLEARASDFQRKSRKTGRISPDGSICRLSYRRGRERTDRSRRRETAGKSAKERAGEETI